MKEIAGELRRELRSNAALSGIRSMVFFPFSFVNILKRKTNIRNHKKKKNSYLPSLDPASNIINSKEADQESKGLAKSY
jgi:hypothetical protein